MSNKNDSSVKSRNIEFKVEYNKNGCRYDKKLTNYIDVNEIVLDVKEDLKEKEYYV